MAESHQQNLAYEVYIRIPPLDQISRPSLMHKTKSYYKACEVFMSHIRIKCIGMIVQLFWDPNELLIITNKFHLKTV